MCSHLVWSTAYSVRSADFCETRNIHLKIVDRLFLSYTCEHYCLVTIVAVHGQLAVTSLPAVLFAGGSQTVVEGSVVWLYCVVNSTDPTLTVTWNKDGVPVVLDVPHLRTRRTSTTSSTTLLLVVENFQPSDSGTYQCSAQVKRELIAMGSPLALIGM